MEDRTKPNPDYTSPENGAVVGRGFDIRKEWIDHWIDRKIIRTYTMFASGNVVKEDVTDSFIP